MKIVILEDEGTHSLMFENDGADVTIDVDQARKTYLSTISLKDDLYFCAKEYEYRISSDPIRVDVRLLERRNGAPLDKYAVKDGVVLESEILSQQGDYSVTKEFIDGLKKEIEWHEEWVGEAVAMYLISLHPEIISSDEYRRYLNQLSERIKSATQRVEKILESDPMGLQVTDEYEGQGRMIWYPRTKVDRMSEEETKNAIAHTRKLEARLFNARSKDYIGIPKDEFGSSKVILENIETFLKKSLFVEQAEADQVRQVRGVEVEERQGISSGMKFGVFVIQWIWLFIVVSIVLWLLSLIITVIQYDFTFAFVISGTLSLIVLSVRRLSSKPPL